MRISQNAGQNHDTIGDAGAPSRAPIGAGTTTAAAGLHSSRRQRMDDVTRASRRFPDQPNQPRRASMERG